MAGYIYANTFALKTNIRLDSHDILKKYSAPFKAFFAYSFSLLFDIILKYFNNIINLAKPVRMILSRLSHLRISKPA